MRSNRSGLLLCLCLSILALSACENATTVGGGLVGGLDDLPEAVVVPASSFASDTFRVGTGNKARILAGQVDDPMLGTMTATGYLDFAVPNEVPAEFRTGPVDSARLVLYPNYTYGATTSPVTFHLNVMPAEFSATGATSDTTLQGGATVMDFTLSPTDTLKIIDLPADWVSANDTTLRSATFGTSFHGFQIQASGGNSVLGFDVSRSVFRVVSNGKTVNYPASQRLWTVQRSGELNLPPNEGLVQDGFGSSVALDFDFNQDSLDLTGKAVNRAVIAVYADTLALQQNAPAGFKRPIERSVILAAMIDTTAHPIGQFVLRDGKFVMTAMDLITVVQQQLMGESKVSGFRVIPFADNTINPILLYSPSEPDEAPRALVTISPTSE